MRISPPSPTLSSVAQVLARLPSLLASTMPFPQGQRIWPHHYHVSHRVWLNPVLLAAACCSVCDLARRLKRPSGDCNREGRLGTTVLSGKLFSATMDVVLFDQAVPSQRLVDGQSSCHVLADSFPADEDTLLPHVIHDFCPFKTQLDEQLCAEHRPRPSAPDVDGKQLRPVRHWPRSAASQYLAATGDSNGQPRP